MALKKLVWLSVLFSQFAWGIVNIESARKDPVEDGWSGKLAVGFEGKKGNTDKDELELGANLACKFGDYTLLSIVNFKRSEVSDTRNTDKWMLHERFVNTLSKQSAFELFIQSEQDMSKRLNVRNLAGAGYRKLFADVIGTKNNLGIGGFYSVEEYDSIADNNGETIKKEETETAFRVNFYWNLSVPLTEQTTLKHTIYVQPTIEDAEDFRIKDELSLNVSITESVGLKVALAADYDSKPADDGLDEEFDYTPLKKFTTDYSTQLTYQF